MYVCIMCVYICMYNVCVCMYVCMYVWVWFGLAWGFKPWVWLDLSLYRLNGLRLKQC